MERVSNPTRWPTLLSPALALALSAIGLSSFTPTVSQAQSTQDQQALSLEQLQQRALQEGEAGKISEAIRDYQNALQLQPAWKEGQWNLGSLQYSAGDFNGAGKSFARVVEFAPDLGIAWALLGLSEFEVKNYASALEHLQKAQSLGIQDDVEIKRVSAYHLGLLLIRSGQFQQASALLTASFGEAPLTDQVKAALGQASLRIPLLPEEINPSQDALILAVGDAVSSGPEAATRLAELVRLHPSVPYLNYAYALLLERTGRPTDAAFGLREESKVSPQSPLPWIELSRLELKTPGKAVQSARVAVDLAPSSREAHESLAIAEKAAGNTKEAAAELATANTLSVWPAAEAGIIQRYAGVRNAKGDGPQKGMQQAMQQYATGQFAEASRNLAEWLKTHPEDGTALAMLGLCEYQLQDFDNARIHLDRGAQLGLNGSPESVATAKYTFGILLLHTGDFERATEVLISANTTSSNSDRIQYALGLALLRRPVFPVEGDRDAKLIAAAGGIALLLQQSKYDEAFPRFKRLLDEYPAVPFLHYAYGTALLALSEFDEAASQMQAELLISPKSELPILRLASISLRQHRAEEAIVWSQRALALTPNSVEAHYLFGRASLEHDDNTTALEQLEIASRLSPGSPEIHFNLAKAYDRAKLPAKAEQERAAFARLNAVSENQRSHQGSQMYSGPRDAGDISRPAPYGNPAANQSMDPEAHPHNP